MVLIFVVYMTVLSYKEVLFLNVGHIPRVVRGECDGPINGPNVVYIRNRSMSQ